MSQLNLRIQQKIDTTTNWDNSTLVLGLGEIGIEQKTLGDGSITNLVKIGNGSDLWKDLPYAQAIAADVAPWAKAGTKPTYEAKEIVGLQDYINGEVQDTNTQYAFAIVEGTGAEAGNNVIVVSKKEVGEEAFTEYARIPVPFTDVSNKAEKTETISNIVNAANNGTLTISKADGTSSDLAIAGVVTVPTYDADARKLTLPYHKADGTTDSVVMDLGKDAVVTSGVYNNETKEIELTLSTGGVVKVPAVDLVDVYTGGTSNSIATTVSADNVITSEVRISSNANNALTVRTVDGEEGLFVEATEFGEASATEAGMMSAEDKAKLDGIEAGSQANVIEVVKVNGTALEVDATDKSVNVVLPEAAEGQAGLLSAEDKAKLDSIEADADVNVLEGVQLNGVDVNIDANKKANIVIAEATATAAGLMSAADKAKIDGLDGDLNGKVGSVTAADNTIEIGGTAIDPTVAVKVSAAEGNQLEVKEDGLYVDVPVVPEYSVVKAETAEEGYISTYHLQKDGVNVGASINIPKDFLVKSGSIEEVAENDVPYVGAVIGDKYLDFVVNVKNGAAEAEEHIYLPVNELVDVYTAGNGIEISAANVVSAKVVAENGLSVDENGIKLGLASADAAGAMSSADFTKLAGIEEGAEVNAIEAVKVGGTEVAINENREVDITEIPINLLKNVEGYTLVLNCGTATEVI